VSLEDIWAHETGNNGRLEQVAQGSWRFVLVTKLFLVVHMRDKMGGACGTYGGGREIYIC